MTTEQQNTSTEQAQDDAPQAGERYITRREFARRKNWAPSHVVGLCQQGKLSLWVQCPGCGSTCNANAQACDACNHAIAGVVDTKKARIDSQLADAELERAKHPEKAHVAARWADARGDATTATAAPGDELPLDDEPRGAGANVASYAQAKADRERYAALQAQLDYERKAGQLGDLEAMRREAFAAARQVRDSLTALPDRLAPVLAAERDVAIVHAALLAEINRVLDELHRSVGAEPGDLAVSAG